MRNTICIARASWDAFMNVLSSGSTWSRFECIFTLQRYAIMPPMYMLLMETIQPE